MGNEQKLFHEEAIEKLKEYREMKPEEVIHLFLTPGETQSTNFGTIHNYFDNPITITIQRHADTK